MDELAGTKANWAGLLVTWYQENSFAEAIYADPEKTPSDAALAYAIRELKARGLKAMLKPHVDGADGSWRGEFGPPDPDAWFANYAAFVLHYACLAEALGVDGLIVGTEYTKLSGPEHRAHWCSVIEGIRSVFSGILIYAANATSSDDEFVRVSFWDKLDLIGLNGYFPLTNHDRPTLAELISAWSGNARGEDMVKAIQRFAMRHDRRVIFTEIGYRSVTGCNVQPWNHHTSAPYDPTEQADCYRAFFEAWTGHSSWMQGVFWWNWTVPAVPPTDRGYNPRSKPAAQVLADWYGAEIGF